MLKEGVTRKNNKKKDLNNNTVNAFGVHTTGK